jgi:hypothetical protein
MALPSRSKLHGPLRPALLALVAALVGGIIGWTSVFAMNTVWGLAVGAVVLIALDGLLVRPDRRRGTVPTMLGWSFAFTLLTWPPLWLIVGLVRYFINGETLGN